VLVWSYSYLVPAVDVHGAKAMAIQSIEMSGPRSQGRRPHSCALAACCMHTAVNNVLKRLASSVEVSLDAVAIIRAARH
jgi:hypothetical protein